MSRFGVSRSVRSPAMLLMLMLGASLMMTCTKANQRTAAEHGVVKNPTLDHGDTLIKIAPGRNISLPCAGTGAIRWFFRRFDGDSDDQLLEEQAEPTPLVRQAMTYDDSGSYECRQEARPTVAISSYTVLVLATPNKKEQLYGEIVPESSQFVEHGATVALACVLYNTDLYDSTMITWSLQPYVDQGTTNVTSWAVAVDRRTSLLVIRNATWRHRGSYHCQLPVGLHDVDFRAITVGERPTPPVDVACVLDNSQYVTCSWLPGNEPRISTAHALRYRQSKTEAWQEAVAAAQSQCECSDTNGPAKDGHCCQIGERFQQRIPGEYLAIGPQMQLQVEVTISNKLGRTAVTTSLSLDDTILRLPPPPFFVARPLNSSCLDVTVGYDSNAATSIWDLLDFDVECDIQYRREGRESNKPSKHATKIGLINADNQDKKQMVICGLAAYTNYTLYARCRPEHSHFQSSSSGPISANTTSAAPLSGPPMTNGAFSLKSLDGGDRLVHLYWQSPQQGDVRGKFTGYKLKKLISGHVIEKPGSADDDIIVNTTSLEVTLRQTNKMQLDIWVVKRRWRVARFF
ncbi:PREDICTED: uncharacterized protein LOC106805010 [Priapulus caudatus]|uniref:Uncharacterized protein LOC106805010 n=1 Tax=Priapulus caudatus TaxID=37621 RepID=A0ABM1DPU1_PRICU|nr:PREDICTED: uncharacterized protein LOC106805010 [Priapulus caudatus]